MKSKVVIAWLLGCFLLVAEEKVGVTLNFAQQNVLSGELLKIDAERRLTLTSPFMVGESSLKTDQLLSLDLMGNAPASEEDVHHVVATINHHFNQNHHDTIFGELISLEEDRVLLRAPYAGDLSLDRRMVLGLEIQSSAASHYNGPDALENWTFTEPERGLQTWSQNGKALVSRGDVPAAREIPTSDRTHISYTMNWKGRGSYRFFFFSNEGDVISPSNRYELSVNNASFLRLTRISMGGGRGGHDTVFSRSYNPLRSQDQATIDLYIDRSGQGMSALYVDGNLLETWTEPKLDAEGGGQDFGNWLHFVPETASPLLLSRLSLSHWDGRLPASKTEVAQDDQGEGVTPNPATIPQADDTEFDALEGQHIRLRNGDTLVGQVHGVKDGHLILESLYGEILVPVERIASIALDQGKKFEPRMWAEDVRAWYHDGGFVTIRLLSVENGKLRGSSQVFGEAEFDLSAFSRIEFNIWQSQFERERFHYADW